MNNNYIAMAGWVVTGFGWLFSYRSNVTILLRTEKAREIKEFELSIDRALEGYLDYISKDFNEINYLNVIMRIDGAVNKLDAISKKYKCSSTTLTFNNFYDCINDDQAKNSSDKTSLIKKATGNAYLLISSLNC